MEEFLLFDKLTREILHRLIDHIEIKADRVRESSTDSRTPLLILYF
ncbi:DUF4368 domain-containing protein [Paenibacillus barengoltzii]|nr:DUF4368 domain-containing protein [Paenibacillus barengoltzii]MEC2346662.1 DUF4368 domain-containing protein [Paenibacillus barengoltzii]